MDITSSDLWWLWEHHPLLSPRLSASEIVGTLELSAYYEAGRMVTGRHPAARSRETFVADEFAIRIDVDAADINGWPKVYEIGFRHSFVAKRYRVPLADLHFYPTGYACLGFSYPWDPPLTLRHFLTELVTPFFYRLAYVDRYGLAAARADLWPEHSHGTKGIIERAVDIRRGAQGLFDHPGGALTFPRS